MSNFEKYFAEFSQPGNRYSLIPQLTASGKASGMTLAEILERAHANGIDGHDERIICLYNGSKVEPFNCSTAWRPRRPPVPTITRQEREEMRRKALPETARNFVPVFLRNYCRRPCNGGASFTGAGTADVFREEIFTPNDKLRRDYPSEAARHLRAVFLPGDLIWAGSIVRDGDTQRKKAFDGRPLIYGGGVVNAYNLAKRIETGDVKTIPTHISLNPVTGRSAEIPNADGKGTHPSYNCKETVACYCNALLEFDDLFEIDAQGVKIPSSDQIDIAAALADYSFAHPEKLRVRSVSTTGGKSIHTILRVRGRTLEEYEGQLAILKDLFASADDPRFRVDLAPFRNHATVCRLAGATRPETGRHAELLLTALD